MSSSRGTNPRPAPWPISPQGGRATTFDWPCSAWSNGSPPPTRKLAGPDTQKDPPRKPQHSPICGCHALHRILRRVGLSPELVYPLPTTEQEVHQIRTLVCYILAAAAEEGKLFLLTPRPTTDHTSAPLQADAYTDTTHTPAKSPPLPLPPRYPAGPHTPTSARTPGPRNTGLPQPPKQPHTPATDPPAEHP